MLKRNYKNRAFLLCDTMIGLMMITVAITLFYFNQSCWMRNENELYLKNLQVQMAYQQSVTKVNFNEEINQIKVKTDQGVYRIDVEK